MNISIIIKRLLNTNPIFLIRALYFKIYLKGIKNRIKKTDYFHKEYNIPTTKDAKKEDLTYQSENIKGILNIYNHMIGDIVHTNDDGNLKLNMLGYDYEINYNYHWNICPISNKKWDNIYGFEINPYINEINYDVKYVWEINRLQFLGLFICKYYKDKNVEHINTAIKYFISWKKQNELFKGINWTSDLEIGLRNISLVLLYYCIYTNDIIPENNGILEQLKKEILANTLFLDKFRSYNKHFDVNNHSIGEEVGIIVGCSIFEAEKITEIETMACKKLLYVLNRCISEDGVYKENSFNYEIFVSELLLVLLMLIRKDRIKQELHSRIISKISELLEHLSYAKMQDGTYPLLGDIDNGVAFRFSEKYDGGNIDFYKKWFEFITKNKYRTQTDRNIIKYYDKGGNLIIKKDSLYLFTRCGNFSYTAPASNTHSHTDLLSLNLSINAINLFSDRGIYAYYLDRELFKEQRSCISHNMLFINDERITNEYNLFSYKVHPKCKILEIKEDAGKVSFRGQLYYNNNVIQRDVVINYNEKKLVITDLVQKSDGLRKAESYWYLSPELNEGILSQENKCIINHEETEIVINFEGYSTLNEYDSIISPSYGIKKRSKVLHLSAIDPKTNYFRIIISWN